MHTSPRLNLDFQAHTTTDESLMEIFVGRELRRRRLELGMSLDFVAKETGISLDELQAYECGTTSVSAIVLYSLSVIYDVDPESFFESL